MLNGKLYDAKTGSLFSGSHSKPSRPKKHFKKPGKALDGFTLHPRQHTAVLQTKKAPKPISAKREARLVKHAAAHHPERAKTLMRSVVKKPAKSPTTEQHSERHARAESVSKSRLISRFGSHSSIDSVVVKRTAPIVVKTPPKPAAKSGNHHTPITASRPSASAASKPNDIFAEALGRATSHQKPASTKTKRLHKIAKKFRVSNRYVSITLSVFIVLAIGGFILLQYGPSLQMRLAAARSGVHASLPDYRPSGYAFGGVSYSTGQVAVTFRSHSDQRAFEIKQSTSSWNSSTLKDTFIVASGQPYQTHEQNGKTVYLYGDANATWVDGGVWYQIQSNNSLSSEQLLNIANSF